MENSSAQTWMNAERWGSGRKKGGGEVLSSSWDKQLNKRKEEERSQKWKDKNALGKLTEIMRVYIILFEN